MLNPAEKLHLAVRGDLNVGAKAAQVAHAAFAFAAEHPDTLKGWMAGSNTVVVHTGSEADLRRLADRADLYAIPVGLFHEPDMAGALTAVAVAPHPDTPRLVRDLPLL